MADSANFALNSSRERTASTGSGYIMLLVLLAVIALQVFGVVSLANDRHGALEIAATVISPLLLLFVACGFYMLQPNQAAAITLFGDYKGSDQSTGLRWVLPWMIRKKVSVRSNNFISERIKVNDLRGNWGPGTGWAVLADPEGNEFCVLRTPAEKDAQAGTPVPSDPS